MSNQKKKVGAGWRKKTQDGEHQFISIVINGGLGPDINLSVWPNSYKKEGSNQPDYVVYLNSPIEKKAPAEKPASEFPEDTSGDDPEVPF